MIQQNGSKRTVPNDPNDPQKNLEKNTNAIQKSKAFQNLLSKHSKEELIEMAKSGNAKKLLQEYVISLVDAKKRTPVHKSDADMAMKK